jgi:hypothetical protein
MATGQNWPYEFCDSIKSSHAISRESYNRPRSPATPETGPRKRKLLDPVAKLSKNVVIQSKINTFRLEFHGLFDRPLARNTIIRRAAGR